MRQESIEWLDHDLRMAGLKATELSNTNLPLRERDAFLQSLHEHIQTLQTAIARATENQRKAS